MSATALQTRDALTRGRAVGVAAVVLVVSCGAPAVVVEAAGFDSIADVRAADAAHARARVHWEECFDAWGAVAQQARQAGAEEAAARAVELRLALSVNLLDAARFEAQRAPLSAAPVQPLSIRVVPGSRIEDDSLERVFKLLDVAKTRYASQPGAEPRDAVLILEARAVVARCRAERLQALADAEYERLWSTLEAPARAGDDAEAVVEAVRVLFQLRRFDEARELAANATADASTLGRERHVAHLRRLRAIALFGRRPAELAAITDRLRQAGGTAEEAPRPSGGLRRLRLGSRADLAAVVRGAIEALTAFRLDGHERGLLAWIAGLCASELGEHALAEELFAGRSEAVEDPWLRAALLGRLGEERSEIGDYEGAAEALRSGIAAAADIRDADTYLGRLRIARGRALLGLGKPVAATAEIRPLLAGVANAPDLALRARFIAAAALYERARTEPELLDVVLRAFRGLERSLEAPEAAKLEEREALAIQARIHAANTLRRLAQRSSDADAAAKYRAEALDTQDEALRRATALEDWTLAAIASANVGELRLEQGDLGRAESFIRWALDRARENRRFETEWRCHWYLGRLALARREGGEAVRAHYERAAAIVEERRSHVISAVSKTGFMSDKLDLYRDMVREARSAGDPERTLEIVERARAQALVESLGWRYVALAEERDRELYRRFVDLAARADAARDGRPGRVLGVDGSTLVYDEVRAELAAAKASLLKASQGRPALRALVDGAPASAAEILSWVPPDTDLVEFFDMGDSHLVLVLGAGRVEAIDLPVASHELRQLTTAFRAGRAEDEAVARRLYDLVVRPIATRVGRRVIIVPHGALHDVPFEAFLGPEGALVDSWRISYLPSASLLRFVRSSAPAREGGERSGWRLLAVADPLTDYDRDGEPDKDRLDHAREEVEAFAPKFARRTVLTGRDATESLLPRAVRGHDVLHFACHGEFDPADPWRSTLFLAPAGIDSEASSESTGPGAADGLLRAWEVYAMDLRGSRLVALSGCETGRGSGVGAEEPVGLAAAFFHSGAPTLLVSLWRVEDAATSALMQAFYDHWIGKGLDAAEALRRAKLELRRSGFGRPGQWAAFICLGDR